MARKQKTNNIVIFQNTNNTKLASRLSLRICHFFTIHSVYSNGAKNHANGATNKGSSAWWKIQNFPFFCFFSCLNCVKKWNRHRSWIKTWMWNFLLLFLASRLHPLHFAFILTLEWKPVMLSRKKSSHENSAYHSTRYFYFIFCIITGLVKIIKSCLSYVRPLSTQRIRVVHNFLLNFT